MSTETEYTSREMMAVAAAREIRDGDIVFCGTGISMLAAMAAKHISAPNSVIFFETGAIDSQLEEVPLAVGDPRVMFATSVNGGLADAFATMQNRFTGRQVVGIMGAAQIDIYGNLNSTVIGDYHHPTVRFSGSGGACDVASFVSRTIIFMQHAKRKFVPKLDYLTSPGWLDGPDGRKNAGLAGRGALLRDHQHGHHGIRSANQANGSERLFSGREKRRRSREHGFCRGHVPGHADPAAICGRTIHFKRQVRSPAPDTGVIDHILPRTLPPYSSLS